jgi:AGCS family alanine or glycine:cation symporter
MAEFLSLFSGWLWGNLLFILLGGGAFFALFSRFSPFRYLGHGLQLLLGKHQEKNAPGEVSHFRALCSALSGTVGMGNVAGVAVAITQGGPGALFWMWVCALLGMATKFYTCSLAVMYRGKDENGSRTGRADVFYSGRAGREVESHWQSFLLAAECLAACLYLQSNQLTQIVRSMFFEPQGWFVGSESIGADRECSVRSFACGSCRDWWWSEEFKRIGSFAARLVPGMVLSVRRQLPWSSSYFTLGPNFTFTQFDSYPTRLPDRRLRVGLLAWLL